MKFCIVTSVLILLSVTKDAQTIDLEIKSPNFGRLYPNNYTNQTYYRAPSGSVFELFFFHFRLEDRDENGTMTDFVRLQHGRRSDNYTFDYLYGELPVPFIVFSRASRLRVRFESNDDTALTGFRFQLRDVETSDLCDSVNLQTNRHHIRSCEDTRISAGNDSSCIVQCRKNYVQRGSIISTCVDGVFSPIECNLVGDLVRECEDSSFANCPYEKEEVLEYYEKHELSSENLSFEELQAILEIELATAGRANADCSRFCRISATTLKSVRPKNCGNLSTSGNRVACIECRFGGGCTGDGFL